MSIPDFLALTRPLLVFADDGGEKNIRDAFEALAQQLELSVEDRAVRVPSGKQTLFENRVHWARTYLDKARAIERTRRSHFRITDRGKHLLMTSPQAIGMDALSQFSEFRNFRGSDQAVDVARAATVAVAPLTPEEAIETAETEINTALRADLLERVVEMPPTSFEQLVVELIVAMGYGGGRDAVARRIGGTGDEGIDGVVNEDPLGLDVIYIQAKRYSAGNNVGREAVQQFNGALVGQGATRGVFFTTSAFTRGAIEYAARVPQRIILVDGQNLSRLMLQYGIGVRVERVVSVRKVDVDYFSPSGD